MPYQKGRQRPSLSRARLIISAGVAKCFHAKNAAAKAEARELYGAAVDRMDLRIMGVSSGAMKPALFESVSLKLGRMERKPIAPRGPKFYAYSFVVGIKRTPTEFADLALAGAQINPKGFRQPSAKPHKWQSTSLVEIASRRAGIMEPAKQERSARAQKRIDAELDPVKIKHPEKYLHAHARRQWLAMRDAGYDVKEAA
jgi:hypothetical protein